MNCPSGEKCGCVLMRSNDLARILASPPSTEMIARCLVPYSNTEGSSRALYAIHLPSGDQAGERSSPGLLVTCVTCAPLSVLSAETTQMSVLYVASGSGVERLLLKANCLPSGDQAISASS